MSDPPRLLDPASEASALVRKALALVPAQPPPLSEAVKAQVAAGVAKAVASASGSGAVAGAATAGAGAATGVLGKLLGVGLVLALGAGGGLAAWRHRRPPAQPALRSVAPPAAPRIEASNAPSPPPAVQAPALPAAVAPAEPAVEAPVEPASASASRGGHARAPGCVRDLTREAQLLDGATRLLTSDARAALAALQEHERLFSDSCAQLRVERELLWARALQRAGNQAGARSRLQRLQRSPLDALARNRVAQLLQELAR